jgi:hypothetical protein
MRISFRQMPARRVLDHKEGPQASKSADGDTRLSPRLPAFSPLQSASLDALKGSRPIQ